MGLEFRNGKAYFYHKFRDGGRVWSEYVGSGDHALEAAELAEQARNATRAKAEAEAAAWDAERRSIESSDRVVADRIEAIDRAVSAALERAGYHRPSREYRWLRKRGPRS